MHREVGDWNVRGNVWTVSTYDASKPQESELYVFSNIIQRLDGSFVTHTLDALTSVAATH
jgi:hypothetical protein